MARRAVRAAAPPALLQVRPVPLRAPLVRLVRLAPPVPLAALTEEATEVRPVEETGVRDRPVVTAMTATGRRARR